MKRLLFPIVLLAAACAQEAPPPAPIADDATRRSTQNGDIIGTLAPNGAHVWRAIPFAAAPEGKLRWRAPRPAARWHGLRQALVFAPRCAQMSNRLNAGEGIEPGRILGSEDCLYLNVYAPADAAEKSLPVMVWIHGGSNVWGRASNYDASRLAQNEDVIVVTVQYRVGPLGFFAHDLLRAQPALGTDIETADGAANFAILDLIASLEWVEENIAAFGGDQDNVTIFGESAGGHNVVALLGAPRAAGLFDRAIIQSGSFDSVSLEEAQSGGEIVNNFDTIVDRLDVDTLDGLRTVSLNALFAAYREGAADFIDMPTIIEDGVVLPAEKLRDQFASPEGFNAVPIITGTNRDEMKFFNFARPDLVKKRLFLFPAPRDPDYYDAMNEYLARIWRIRSVDQPAAMMEEGGHAPVYGYRFDWDESGRFWLADFSRLVGAGHAVEIPFVFNRFEIFGPRYDKVFFSQDTEASRQALSRAMGAYWAAFARSGNPGEAGGPAWPPYGENGGALMFFDSTNDGGVAVRPSTDSIGMLIGDLASDTRLASSERCAVIREIAFWQKQVAAQAGAALGCSPAKQGASK